MKAIAKLSRSNTTLAKSTSEHWSTCFSIPSILRISGGQFCDRGHAYTTAIYVADEEQRAAAEKAKAAAQAALGQEIVTPIEPAGPFWAAEDYHQNYYKKNPLKYRYYRYACGRNERVEDVWKDAAYEGVPSH